MKLFNILSLIALFSFSFVACKDDDKSSVAKPIITLTEVGHDNSCIGHIGDDLHLEAEIVAEGSIKRIDIEIHQEEGGKFEIEKSYTEGKYIGVKNAEFHEHIDIPAEAAEGEYHLHFTVVDGEGQSTTVESDVEIQAAAK